MPPHGGTCFNPRPRTGGDLISRDRSGFFNLSFNPRPRTGGDDFFYFFSGFAFQVSIHAPARGATPSGER